MNIPLKWESGRNAEALFTREYREETIAVWRFQDGQDIQFVAFLCDGSNWQSFPKFSAEAALESAMSFVDMRNQCIPAAVRLTTQSDQPSFVGKPRRRGFTLVELVVVVTIVALLSAIAVTAYNGVVQNSKTAKVVATVNALANAKTLFANDPNTQISQIASYNKATGDTQFGFIAPYIRVNGTAPTTASSLIAPYIRVNGTAPTTTSSLIALEGLPQDGSVTITLGTIDDGTGNTDIAPTVNGYP